MDEGCLGKTTWKQREDNVLEVYIARLYQLKDSLPSNTEKTIYNVLVLPHLDYCCVVWMECADVYVLQQRVERIQIYAMRLIYFKPPRMSI